MVPSMVDRLWRAESMIFLGRVTLAFHSPCTIKNLSSYNVFKSSLGHLSGPAINTRCNINLLFNKINKSTCHLIYFDEQCLFRQVGSQEHYAWRCYFGTPHEFIHGRIRHAQHEGARRCGRSCADRDHLGEALAVAAKDKLPREPRRPL